MKERTSRYSKDPHPESAASTYITLLGIDPGLSNTGYAVVEADLASRRLVRTLELGTICTERDNHTQVRRTSDDLRRARILRHGLQEVVQRFGITVAANEMISTSPYARPSFNFGVTLGVIASFDFMLLEVLPKEIKKAVTGNAAAKKQDIIRWALEVTQNDNVQWPTSGRQNRMDLSYRARHVTLAAEHQADALAVAYTALQSDQLRDLLALQQAIGRGR
ncbi:crossover junction endodeoxyribonuclease RuvC [Sphingomonas sp. Tas61C01]|uniref:crossover junction endodeoxyribonuclease RuvC n=1 Tax=Sphingomonas sp. Tas61C01 TaxID=3458297 RepID=UPI00403E9651